MKRIMDWLDNLSGFLMLSGAVVGLICVFSRYVLKKAIIWGDEADIFLFIWMLFLTIGSVTYEGSHLNTNIIQYLVKSKTVERFVFILTIILTIGISALIIRVGLIPVKTAFLNNRFSDSGTFPMALIFLALPLGFFFNVLGCVFSLFKKTPESCGRGRI
jgi:TRAP-type C4-dicarboxylate transport system permease small subunit